MCKSFCVFPRTFIPGASWLILTTLYRADTVIALVHERLANLPAGLDELGRRIDRDQPDVPLTLNEMGREAGTRPSDPQGQWSAYGKIVANLGMATSSIYWDTVSLMRKVWSSTRIEPREHGNSQGIGSQANDLGVRIVQQIATEIADLKTSRSRLVLLHNQKHLIPRTRYTGPTCSDRSMGLKEISYIKGRSRLLILTAARIYVRAITTRTPITRSGSPQEVLELRGGIFEIPNSYCEGNEDLFMWIMFPLLCILDSPQGRTDLNVSERNRRHCKALVLRAALVHAARRWHEAKDLLEYMTRFSKWLRKESE